SRTTTSACSTSRRTAPTRRSRSSRPSCSRPRATRTDTKSRTRCATSAAAPRGKGTAGGTKTRTAMSEELRGPEVKPFGVGGATFGDGRLTVIAVPCVVESREHALFMARECQRRTRDAGLDYVFKASYDKANRSSHASYRGPGMSEGLEALRAIKEET